MKSYRTNRIFAGALSCALIFLTMSPLNLAANPHAQAVQSLGINPFDNVRKDVKESIRNRDNRDEYSIKELEQMRTVLLELNDTNYYLAEMFHPYQNGLIDVSRDGIDDFTQIRTQIGQLTAAELTALRKVLDPVKIHQKLVGAVERIDQAKAFTSKYRGKSETAGLPEIDFFCKGQGAVLGITAPVAPATLSAADDVFFIAEGVRDIAQNGCNQVAVVVVLGEGGGANTRLACNITDGIYLVAKALDQKFNFCDDDYDSSVLNSVHGGVAHLNTDIANGISSTNSAISSTQVAIVNNATTNKTEIKNNDDANRVTIVNNDNTNKNTIVSNDNTNKNTIVTNDNSNKDTIVANDDSNFVSLTNTVSAALASIIGNANANKDEVKNLLLRTQIEADLSINDGSPWVALYQTPNSICFPALNPLGLPQAGSAPQCGLLDLVRTIVSQTIANGGNDSGAQKSFDKADGYKADGRFSDAYKYYRKAYKDAVKKSD